MGLFSKPEVIILKESNDAREYLTQLEELSKRASGEALKLIEKEILITKAGIAGEDNILFELKNSGMDLVVLHDLYLETSDGNSAQIDFLIISNKLCYVVECKNLFGNIEINSKGDFIRTIQYGNRKYKEGIYSPITQNERHLQVMKDKSWESIGKIRRIISIAYFYDYYKSLVVLANPKTAVNDRFAKKEVRSKVIKADQIIQSIKTMNRASKEPKYSLKEMKMIGERWIERSCKNPVNRIAKFEELIEKDELKTPQNETSENERVCPRCGNPLVLREAKRGEHIGEKFWGCSNFPHCRYMEKAQ